MSSRGSFSVARGLTASRVLTPEPMAVFLTWPRGFNFPLPLSWPVNWDIGTYLSHRVAFPGSFATWLVLGTQQVLRNAGGRLYHGARLVRAGRRQGRSEIPTFAPDPSQMGHIRPYLTTGQCDQLGSGVGGGLAKTPGHSEGAGALTAVGAAFPDDAVGGCKDSSAQRPSCWKAAEA